MLGETDESSEKALAGDGGFIVSHRLFDEGADSKNYYQSNLETQLELKELSSNDTILLTLLTFQLSSPRFWWDDYLEISDIRGYPKNKQKIWSFSNEVFEIYPITDHITFKFVTSAFGSAAGFIIKYEGQYYIATTFTLTQVYQIF